MKRTSHSLSHLLRHWRDVAERIRAKRRVVVLMDFDGTLVQIAPRPELVRVTPAMRRILRKLAANPRARLAIISGRRRDELKRYVPIPKMRYIGLYGMDRGRKETLPPSARMALRRARALLLQKLTTYPRVWIEPKKSSFSVHLLDARPGKGRGARQIVRELVESSRGSLCVLENLRDLEVMPNGTPDKGAAVRGFLSRVPNQDALPFFFGDDFSDEPAFRAARGGVTVLVGKRRKTHARFRLRGPDEVAEALTRLEEALS